MSDPLIDTARVDRGAWKLYVGAGVIALAGVMVAHNGAWGPAFLAALLALQAALHPSLRRSWYRIGYLDGYCDAPVDIGEGTP